MIHQGWGEEQQAEFNRRQEKRAQGNKMAGTKKKIWKKIYNTA